ncbi:MAG: hypothetical protein V4538_16925 [Bacteroidota bacterium]
MIIKSALVATLLAFFSQQAFSQNIPAQWSEIHTLENVTGMYHGNPVNCIGENENNIFIISYKDLKKGLPVLQKLDKETLKPVIEIKCPAGVSAFVNAKTVDVIEVRYEGDNYKAVSYVVNRYNHNLELLETIPILGIPSRPTECFTPHQDNKGNVELNDLLDKHNVSIKEWNLMAVARVIFRYDKKTRTYQGRNLCMHVILDENFKVIKRVDNTLEESLSLNEYSYEEDGSFIAYGPGGIKTNGVFTAFPYDLPKGFQVVSSRATLSADKKTVAVAIIGGKKFMDPDRLLFRTYSLTGELKTNVTIQLTKEALEPYKKLASEARVFHMTANNDGSFGIHYGRDNSCYVRSSEGTTIGSFGPTVYIKISAAGELLMHSKNDYLEMSTYPYDISPYLTVSDNQTLVIRNEFMKVHKEGASGNAAGIYIIDAASGNFTPKGYVTLPEKARFASMFTSQINDKTFLLLVYFSSKKYQIAYVKLP